MRRVKHIFLVIIMASLVLAGLSMSVVALPTPPAPTVTPISVDTLKISWYVVSGADYYSVYRATSASGPYSQVVIRAYTGSTSWINTGLSPNTTYYYKVTAKNDSSFPYETSDMSNYGYGTTLAVVPAIPPAPTVVSRTSNSITISGYYVAGATSYKFYMATNAAGPYNYTGTDTATTVTTGSNLLPNTTYYFKVSATNSGGTSAMSNYGYGTTLALPDITAPTGSISINNGAATASSTSVTLNISATDNVGVTQMEIRNDNSLFTGSWQPYSTSKSWSLSSGTGTKYVYIRFRDAAGNISSTYYDSISYPTLSSISISPSSASITGANKLYGALTVTAYYSNGSSANVTGSTSFSSSNSSVAYMSGSSLYSGSTAGNATITASYSGKTATCSVRVSIPATLSSISVSPSSASITGTNTYYGTLLVTAYYSDGSSTNVTGSTSTTFSSSNSSIAYMAGRNLYSGSSAGNATITASYSGKTATCSVTVSSSPSVTLSSISVSPASASITGANKLYGALTVTAYYTNGTSTTVTGSTSFSSSNSSVAYMSGSNLYSGSSTGSATITASYSGRTATCSVTVTPADTTPPTISTTSPSSGAANFGIASSITITFSEAVQAGSASATLKDGTGTAVPFAATISGAVLTIKPNASLLNNTIYTVSIPANAVKDAAGNNYNPTPNPYTFSFTTAPAPSSGGSDVFIVPVNTTFTIYMMGEFQGLDTWTIPGDSNTYTNKVTVTPMTGQGYTTITGSFNGQGPKFGSIGPTNVKVNFFVVAAPDPNSSAKVKFSN